AARCSAQTQGPQAAPDFIARLRQSMGHVFPRAPQRAVRLLPLVQPLAPGVEAEGTRSRCHGSPRQGRVALCDVAWALPLPMAACGPRPTGGKRRLSPGSSPIVWVTIVAMPATVCSGAEAGGLPVPRPPLFPPAGPVP